MSSHLILAQLGEMKSKKKKKKQRQKYASLLEGMNEDEEAQNMEITFTSGLSEKVEDLVEQVKRNKEEEESVFHKQLRLKKEKKRKQRHEGASSENPEDSDDEIIGQHQTLPKLSKKAQPKASKMDDELRRQNLELLVMEENLSRPNAQKKATDSKATKVNKRASKKKKKKAQEAFDVDLDDRRFIAIANSPDYAQDPTR